MSLPKIIQAGMGIGVSDWILAKAVGMAGQMGVVSGTAIDSLMVRRLQQGDLGGHIARAFAAFPCVEMAQRIYQKYFIQGGISPGKPFARLPMLTARMSIEQIELLILSNFTEVYLAKEGHQQPIGINFLEKIQLPVLPSLYGAMLANVDYVLMGAGIPREIPGIMDLFCEHKEAQYSYSVQGALPGESFKLTFDPKSVMPEKVTSMTLPRPKFLAIISSNVLATTLAKRIARPVDGFVIEAPSAGGHNAPPRGKMTFNERGEPLYGDRDLVDFAGVAQLGLPFWLAGSMGHPEGLKEALAVGAAGVQVGTAFALCKESGLDEKYKDLLRRQATQAKVDVYTDPLASPTGFPFKVANMAQTISQSETYEERPRCCDLGYLREAYRKEDGSLGYRCASEPIDNYLKKGGPISEVKGRKCLCNGLFAALGKSQIQVNGYVEKPILTIGDDVNNLQRLLRGGQSYTAKDVLDFILGKELEDKRSIEATLIF